MATAAAEPERVRLHSAARQRASPGEAARRKLREPFQRVKRQEPDRRIRRLDVTGVDRRALRSRPGSSHSAPNRLVDNGR